MRRGQLLKDLIAQLGFKNVNAFARTSGIFYGDLFQYLAGARDVAEMTSVTVEKLLGTLNVTDGWAWAYFDIPLELRDCWRTFRPSPTGHGERQRGRLDFQLEYPLQGDLNAPAGTFITVDPNEMERGLIVVRFPDRYFAMPAGTIPGWGQAVGQLISVHCLPAKTPSSRK